MLDAEAALLLVASSYLLYFAERNSLQVRFLRGYHTLRNFLIPLLEIRHQVAHRAALSRPVAEEKYRERVPYSLCYSLVELFCFLMR